MNNTYNNYRTNYYNTNNNLNYQVKQESNGPHEDLIQNLLRNEYYLTELYEIKETINYANDTVKMYGCTRDKFLNVIISKQDLILEENNVLLERIYQMIKLVEENVILVENIWIEEILVNMNYIKKYSLIISEFSKETYRSEYGLINLSFYMQKTRGADIEKNLALLKNILVKLQTLHNMNFAHLNLTTSNIYFNNNSNEVFLGPIKFGNYEDNELWYSSPESTFYSLLSGEKSGFHMQNSQMLTYLAFDLKNDIWSIGCIIAELFFLASPLFQAFTVRDKIRKVIEIIGLPKYQEVNSYISIKEFNLISDTYKKNFNSLDVQYKPLIYELIDYNSRTANAFKKELFDCLTKTLSFNPNIRPEVYELIGRVTDLDDLSFNYTNRDTPNTDRYPKIPGSIYEKYKNNMTNFSARGTSNKQESKPIIYDDSENTSYLLDTPNNNLNSNNVRREQLSSNNTISQTNSNQITVEKKINSTNPKGIKNKLPDENEEYKNLNLKLDDLMVYLKQLEQSK